MSNTLPHGEAWLLEIAVRHQLPVCGLARSDEDLHAWLLRGGHGLSRTELHSTLRRLFDAGDIAATIDDVERPPFSPSDAQLEAALSRHDKRLRYGLTAQGGARWESLAKPDWSRFFDRDDMYGDEKAEILAGSYDRIVELMCNSDLVWSIRLTEAEPHIEKLEPWEATAWKTLPIGFCTRARYENLEPDFSRRQEWRRTVRWCTSLLGHASV